MEHIKIKTIKYGRYKVMYYSDETTFTGKTRYIHGYDNLQKLISKYDEEAVRV